MRPALLALGVFVGCAGAGQDRFASPVAPLAGCYAFEYGPWPLSADEWKSSPIPAASAQGFPSPEALPGVIELTTARVAGTEEAAVGGWIHEVSSHGRPGRGILHYWRMADSDSVVIWTGGPAGFRLDAKVEGERATGTTQVFSADRETSLMAPLTGIRTPCPRQGPIGT